jgi:hypothetical protein
MIEAEISVEVYCDWDLEQPAYRVYVGEDLLTERTYRWVNPEQFICERMIVNVDPGIHNLRILAVNPEYQDKFSIRNVHVNHQLTPCVNNQILIQ